MRKAGSVDRGRSRQLLSSLSAFVVEMAGDETLTGDEKWQNDTGKIERPISIFFQTHATQ